MKAVLYICHGSRVQQAQDQAVDFIRSCMSENLAPIQEYCFLELASPTIEAGFMECVAKGATEIIAIPVLLLTAGHAKTDIPNEIARLSSLFPDIKIKYGKPIGVHPAITDILVQRIVETNHKLSKDALILLVGRGSSDQAVVADLTEIVDMLKRRLGLRVEACFLTAAKPSLETALQFAQKSHSQQIYVIPYLLFSGILMKKVKKMISQEVVPTEQSHQIILCRHLGYHPIMKKIVYDRVQRATAINRAKEPNLYEVIEALDKVKEVFENQKPSDFLSINVL